MAKAFGDKAMPRGLAILGFTVGVLAFAPFVLGFAYSILGVPAYGLVCNDWSGILKGTVSADEYRIFLMNRGCNLNEEIARIVQDNFQVRPDQALIEIVKGKQAPRNADDVAMRDWVEASLRTFRPVLICGALNKKTPVDENQPTGRPFQPGPTLSETERAAQNIVQRSLTSINACYRGVHQSFNDDLLGRIIGSILGLYGSYLVLNLNWSINLGADTLNALSNTGPFMVFMLIAAYLVLFWLGKLLVEVIRDALKQTLKKAISDLRPRD